MIWDKKIYIVRCREPVWGILPVAKVMRKEARHTRRRDLASGVPPGFSWTSTLQNQSQPALLYYAFHSSDILWKKLTQGFSLLHMKRMSGLISLWWLSNLPNKQVSPDVLKLVNCLQPLKQEAQSLKHLKDTEPFLRAKNPIGDGFSLLTQWLLPGLHILYLLGTWEDVNQCKWDMEKDI